MLGAKTILLLVLQYQYELLYFDFPYAFISLFTLRKSTFEHLFIIFYSLQNSTVASVGYSY